MRRPNARGRLIGSAMGVAIFGAMLGPVIGGIASLTSTEATFGGIALVGLGLAAWAAATSTQRTPSGQPVSKLFGALAKRRMLASVWLVALPSISFGALGVLAPLQLHDLGLGAVAISAVWLVAIAFEATAAPLVGSVSDRRGRLWPLRLGAVAAAVCFALFTVLDARWGRSPRAIVVCSFSLGAFWAPSMSLASDEADTLGLDYAFGFAIINLAWAPGAGRRERGRRAAGGRDVGRGRLPRARRAVRAYAWRPVEIRKLLVANRGEIALRVFRTCRALGIGTVAVAAPDDRGSLHARSADETVEIAGYLHSEEHIRAAKETGADAIHPGYGFLAESPDFAEAVDAAGLVWVGPTADALRAGGDKLEAKRIAREAGVPVVETGEPEELGFPLLLKAAAGGGGRGMRVVRVARRARRGAGGGAARGEGGVRRRPRLRERYVERPRHVEIQLLGDTHGNVVALGERECSIQRRHQKVLEESPSPALDPRCARAMSDAAVAFARAIGYTSAGTAEFMLDGRDFYFLELNGRIQVEHPVTELVTGVDLVERAAPHRARRAARRQ